MKRLKLTNDDILDAMEAIRGRNNKLWMKLVAIAIKTKDGRQILKDIAKNDKAITKCLSQLSDR